MADDFITTTSTTETLSVGSAAHGNIEAVKRNRLLAVAPGTGVVDPFVPYTDKMPCAPTPNDVVSAALQLDLPRKDAMATRAKR